MVTRYGQADIPREVRGRRADRSITFIQYVHIRCWINNNCANCALTWEIHWFDGELFIHTCMTSPVKRAGPRFNIKISSYLYRKAHCGDKTVVRSSYLHDGIYYTGKKTSLYWIRAQGRHLSSEARGPKARPSVQYLKDCPWPIKSQNTNMDLLHI